MLLFRVAAFADHYRWSPPPMFSISLTIVLIGVFIHQTFKQSVVGGEMLNIFYFLGPRGPLVLPSVGPSVRPSRPSARKIWITYIQAYMPYES